MSAAHPLRVARTLLALCAFAVVQLVASVVYAHVIDGYVGIEASTEVAPFVGRIDAVDPNSPVARDGLRPNDRILERAMSASDRIDLSTYFKVGRTYALPVVRAGKRITVLVHMDRNIADDPGWQAIRGQFYLGFFGILLMLAIAGFLVVKRPDRPDVKLLAALLICVALGEDFGRFGAWQTMSDVLTTAGYALSPFLLNAGLALLGTYALLFATPPSRLRRAITVATYALAAVAAAFAAADPIGYQLGIVDDSFGFFSTTWYGVLVNVVPALMPLGCALLAIFASRGEERTRIVWATSSLALLYVAQVAFFVAVNADLNFTVAAAIKNCSFPLAAAGLTYALLGRRLLDVGFTLNRTAVFAGVSLVVFGAFSLAEWALGGWLASASRTTNVAVSALLALGLGLAIQPIHRYTDRFVDNIFFRKRHEAEQALRRFAKEVTFISEPALVIDRTCDALRSQTGTTSAEILIYDGRSFGDVDENDPALLALRATQDVVSLRDRATRLRGELCFPLSAGGRLLGALVVGPKLLGEPFAPDERDAMGLVAHGAGVALALLGATVAAPPATSIEALAAAIEALPDVLAAKLTRGRERAFELTPPDDRR